MWAGWQSYILAHSTNSLNEEQRKDILADCRYDVAVSSFLLFILFRKMNVENPWNNTVIDWVQTIQTCFDSEEHGACFLHMFWSTPPVCEILLLGFSPSWCCATPVPLYRWTQLQSMGKARTKQLLGLSSCCAWPAMASGNAARKTSVYDEGCCLVGRWGGGALS